MKELDIVERMNVKEYQHRRSCGKWHRSRNTTHSAGAV
uniref:Uncharacterized protein n=1 Tax=Arundo donax TaxID=35708 RepID=A0A0A9CBI5_ARUDO